MDISSINVTELNHQLWLANANIEVSAALGSVDSFNTLNGDHLDTFDSIEDATFELLFNN
jgi:hypothetical protein